MSYTVLKPLYIAGKRRIIGEILSHDEVEPKRVYSLVKNGYIAELKTIPEVAYNDIQEGVDFAQMQEDTISITVPIKQGKDSFEIEITVEDAVKVFEVLQESVEVAAECIKDIEKEEILTLIDAIDNRKGVKSAAVEQAKKLKENLAKMEDEEGEK